MSKKQLFNVSYILVLIGAILQKSIIEGLYKKIKPDVWVTPGFVLLTIRCDGGTHLNGRSKNRLLKLQNQKTNISFNRIYFNPSEVCSLVFANAKKP